MDSTSPEQSNKAATIHGNQRQGSVFQLEHIPIDTQVAQGEEILLAITTQLSPDISECISTLPESFLTPAATVGCSIAQNIRTQFIAAVLHVHISNNIIEPTCSISMTCAAAGRVTEESETGTVVGWRFLCCALVVSLQPVVEVLSY